MDQPKKHSRRWLKIGIPLAVVVAAGIALYFYLTSSKAVSLVLPDIQAVTYMNLNIKDGIIRAKLDIIVENHRPYKMVIDSIVCNLGLEGHTLIKEKLHVNLKLRGYSKDTIPFPFQFKFKEIKHNLDSLQINDSTNLDYKGYVIYSTLVGRIKLPFDRKVIIPTPLPPELKILRVERKQFKLSDKTLAADVIIQIINKGKNIELELHDVYYDFKVKDLLSTVGTIKQRVSIKPGETKIITIPIIVDLKQPLKTALMIKTDNDRVKYDLYMRANLEEKRYSKTNRMIPTELNASGMMELKK